MVILGGVLLSSKTFYPVNKQIKNIIMKGFDWLKNQNEKSSLKTAINFVDKKFNKNKVAKENS